MPRLYYKMSGPKQQHTLDGVLQQAIDSFEPAASRFTTDFIKDANARQMYSKNIKRISDAVKEDVAPLSTSCS